MTDEQLVKLVSEGKGYVAIRQAAGAASITIQKAVKRLGLVTFGRNKHAGFDWREIQIEHDSGSSWALLCSRFGVTTGIIRKARRLGIFKSRTQKEARVTAVRPSLESRKRMSELVKERYRKNPEKHPFRIMSGNRNKMSFPERVVFNFLTGRGLVFDFNKSVPPYFPDFIIGSVIIEVDGKPWHSGARAEYDKKRDANLVSRGYRVFRFDAKAVVKDPNIVLSALKV